MAVWDKQVLCGFMFLLAGAESQRVNYPDPVCAVKGSSVTLPCSFTHPKKYVTDRRWGTEVSVQIIRVLWCQNHPICKDTTPSVYDSEEKNNINNPRYSYLGDKKGDCTLQIRDVQKEDEATLRFRMEADPPAASFTDQQGVNVTVADGAQMKIRSSRDGEFKINDTVTLTCTTTCTFHQLEVTWSRDGHALNFTGPSLHLGALTAKDSGNYTCGLKNNVGKLSPPHRLFVEDEGEEEEEEEEEKKEGKEEKEAGEDKGVSVPLIVSVVFGVLLALCTLVLVLCIIRRKRAADKSQSAVREEAGLKEGGAQRQEARGAEADVNYAPIQFKAKSQTSNNQKGGAQRQEARGAEADVNYAPIRFKAKSQTRPVEEDAIIYSSVVDRA